MPSRLSNELRRRGRIWTVLLTIVLALSLAPAAGATRLIYWWQHNMPVNSPAYDRSAYRNHIYNELYFGYGAGWRGEVWEVTPAGYRHYDKWCQGNCFNAHPGTYSTYAYCANRDGYGTTHFVYDCQDEW